MTSLALAKNNRTFRFSRSSLEALPAPESREVEYSDLDVKGLKAVVNQKRRIYWLFRYTFNGRKRAKKIGDFPTLNVAAARSRALDCRRLIAEGLDPQACEVEVAIPTFKEYCEEDYLPRAKAKKRSFSDDLGKLNHRIYPYFGSKLITSITGRDVEHYLNSLRESGLAFATCNRHLALLRTIFNLAVQGEVIVKSPCAYIKGYQENNQRDRSLTREELGRLMSELNDSNPATQDENQVVVALIKLLLLTGTRKTEALSAKWEHVDLVNKRWFLPSTKNGRSRYVHLNNEACELLSSLSTMGTHASVFVNPKTGVQLADPRRAFMRILKRAGINSFRIHDLRHSYASMAVNSGASLYVVQHLLGHASSTTTARYSHLQAETLMAASQQVANMVSLNSPAI